MTKTGFPLLPYLKAKNGSSETNEFNDLENRKSRGIPRRDTASRKLVEEALKFLDRNLHGLRRGTAKHEYLIGRVRASRRPLSTAKAICRDYLKVDQRGPECDPSDIQELWVRVFRRQGRIIYPEQERIFRQLERRAIQGSLGQGDLDRADKVLRMFKAPGTLDRSWAKAELLTDLALSGGGGEWLLEPSAKVDESEACRVLMSRGIVGPFETWRQGISYPCMKGDIEKAAGLSDYEPDDGVVHFARWRPLDQNAVSRSAVLAPARENDGPVGRGSRRYDRSF